MNTPQGQFGESSSRTEAGSDALLALRVQHRAVRAEIDLRIRIQSAIIVLVAVGGFIAAAIVALFPPIAMEIAIGFAISTLLLSLHWMHNDIRHLQLGQYLAKEIEPRMFCGFEGWEQFHARLPRPTSLGSYWFVGTKGVLIVAPILVGAMAYMQSASSEQRVPILIVLICVTAIFVFTRLPKKVKVNAESSF